MKSININEDTKVIFDTLQAEMSGLKGRLLSQDEVLKEIVETYRKEKVKA
jgi:hypothetical protein